MAIDSTGYGIDSPVLAVTLVLCYQERVMGLSIGYKLGWNIRRPSLVPKYCAESKQLLLA